MQLGLAVETMIDTQALLSAKRNSIGHLFFKLQHLIINLALVKGKLWLIL